ncbi:RagB/SusD family nutrient uptake outer membrane protein [Aestuariivivens sediminis]|uniref:RagB/SusD family nutrient uptake outer membrane protein n=1 Tax=Aestuariivivens sediminis TaxID=2913557 RepID=UPI001F57D2F3|nr:RagB/SusD family nutrient uptake outer membrane protein [Aestuariivivens sediminis]
MINIRIPKIVLMTLVLFSSCAKDVLDTEPLDKVSSKDVWNDSSLAEGFIFDTYQDVMNLWYNQRTDDWTDNTIPNVGSRNAQIGNIQITDDYGWNQYSKIRKCNLAIAELSNSTSINENVRNRLIAEAKLLRAMTNFWMARRFGGVMKVDKPLQSDEDFFLSRMTERETYDFILQDANEATIDLPETAEKGRFTKFAAYAFITQAALQIGDYDDVIEAANMVEQGGYSLDVPYSNMFKNFETAMASPEIIFLYHAGGERSRFIDTPMQNMTPNNSNAEVYPGKLPPSAIPQFANGDYFEGWPDRWPSQNIVDAYLIKDNGEAVQKTWQDWEGQPSKLAWQNRDDRFEQTIVRDSAQYRSSIFTFRRGGNMHWTSFEGGPWGVSTSGYAFRKWIYEDEFVFWDLPVDYAEPIFRLGEVYLNKAEAYGRKGNLSSAIEYMNYTRTIHGGLPALSSGASLSEFWNAYKIERRVELAFEDDRYWSLIRWARAENASGIPELNGYKLRALDMQFDGIFHTIDGGGAGAFPENFVFEYPKRLFFPIPDSEIRRNDKLTQNPGW